MKKLCIALLLSLVVSFNAAASELLDLLMKIPEVSHIEKIFSYDLFNEAYTFMFTQYYDQRDTTSPTFLQKVIIQHNNFNSPVVVCLEGYMIPYPYTSEPCEILNANQVIIEHRFFGESVPKDGIIPWDYLTIYNAAADQHRIIEALRKNVYPASKWLSTGASKGGQATVFHRFFFSDDVDASIAYVTPINLDLVDPRLQRNLDKLGSAKHGFMKAFEGNGGGSAKYTLRDFQIYCFEHFDELLPLFEALVDMEGYKYNYVGSVERALQLIILEYPFSFWQTGGSLQAIPREDVDDITAFFDHLIAISDPTFLEDSEIEDFMPFYYQAFTEIGFYDYKVAPFRKYLPDDKEDINFLFCLNEEAKEALERHPYNKEKMHYVNKWLQNDARTIMFIYGGTDAWSGTQVNLKDNQKCCKFICENMDHSVEIADFDPVTCEYIKEKIAIWMER